jgi:hypothetical protein
VPEIKKRGKRWELGIFGDIFDNAGRRSRRWVQSLELLQSKDT